MGIGVKFKFKIVKESFKFDFNYIFDKVSGLIRILTSWIFKLIYIKLNYMFAGFMILLYTDFKNLPDRII